MAMHVQFTLLMCDLPLQAGTLVFVGIRGRPVEKDVEPLDRRRETETGVMSENDPVQVPNAVSVSEGRIVFQFATRAAPD